MTTSALGSSIRVCVASDEIRSWIAPSVPCEIVVWDGGPPPPTEIDILVADPRYAEVDLSTWTGLSAVQLTSAGVGDWAERTPPDIQLCNARGVGGAATAELALAGLLSMVRRLPTFEQAQREHRWASEMTHTLVGAGVLILGAGDIGSRIASCLRALGAVPTLVGQTRRAGVGVLADVLPGLSTFRAVVVALPRTPQTTNLVDARFLASLADATVVVNVARGEVIERSALLTELRSGRLSAFLDVTDPEPLLADDPLWDAPGVRITPHVGAYTQGWQERVYGFVADQIDRLATGRPLVNVLTSPDRSLTQVTD